MAQKLLPKEFRSFADLQINDTEDNDTAQIIIEMKKEVKRIVAEEEECHVMKDDETRDIHTEDLIETLDEVAENFDATTEPLVRSNNEGYCIDCTKYIRITSTDQIKRGDSIRIKRKMGVYYHHAIVKDVDRSSGDTKCSVTLIHLDINKKWDKVIKEEKQQFNFRKDCVEKVRYMEEKYSPDEIVKRAEDYMKEANENPDKYNLLTNNCEHMATIICQDTNVSNQVFHLSENLGRCDSGLKWILNVFYKIGSKFLRFPGISAIVSLISLTGIINDIVKIKNYFKRGLMCTGCFFKKYKSLKVSLIFAVIGVAVSLISHFNWVTLIISLVVGIGFPLIAPLVTKKIMPFFVPAFNIPKKDITSASMILPGDVITFNFRNLPHEAVVTEVTKRYFDNNLIKATIVHFPVPDLFERYTVTKEVLYIKPGDDVCVLDFSKTPHLPASEVVKKANEEEGKHGHSIFTYRSSHLSRFCKTGNKKIVDLPKNPIKSTDDLSPGDIIEYVYKRFPHEAVVVKVEHAENVDMKIVHYNYNETTRKDQIVEESVSFNLADDRLSLHDYKDSEVYERAEVVRRALSRVGEENFNCLWRRSSHLAKWCKVKTDKKLEKND